MPTSPTSPPPGAFAGRLRRWVYQLRTEGGSPSRDAAAIGLGVFIGCSPFYGLHLAMCWLAGRLLRLNRLKMYLAANVSNPLMAPFIVLAELQVGAWIRRGRFHSLTLETLRATGPWVFGADILIGSAIVGAGLGAIAALATWLSTRAGDDPAFAELVRRASDRYVATSITAWEFARGKLRGDPLYRTVITSGILPSGGLLVDVGCGQGLMLALLAEAAAEWRQGAWPASLPPPPVFDRLSGIELRAHVAALARQALADAAEIVEADARSRPLERCHAVLLFDVLHLMPIADQDRLLRAVFAGLDPGGTILVREADAAAGWRFQAVRFGNALKALAFGRWRQTFHFRTAAEWKACFEQAGFRVDARDTSGDTPFGNVLFVLRGSASA
jgi:uncharacterized protein (DUF2062 family)